MKLKYSFELIDMENEIICVPVGEGASVIHGILKLNKEGKEIIDLLKEDTSEEEIVNILKNKYENDTSTLISYVHNIVSTLYDARLLD